MSHHAENPTALPAISFAVSEEMVRQFATLTGDFSSLHMNADFARRSMYRENVVHGFLPLLFVAALDWSKVADRSLELKRLAGSFLKPVYAGDRLTFTPAFLEKTDEQIELEFEITITDTGALVTTGSAVFRPIASRTVPGSHAEKEQKDGKPPNATAPASLLKQPLQERSLEFDHINKDDEAQFHFGISEETIAGFTTLLKNGLPATETCVACESLIAASLFSTMVGMCFPGKRATFLNFEVSFSTSVPRNECCRLLSKIAFKSATTSTISQLLTFLDSKNRIWATGKIHARVNAPPSKMPSMNELTATEIDLGLREKVVLITGGSRGIGETTAKLFALHGAKVVINYLQSDTEADQIVREIKQHGGEAIAVQADVSDRPQVAAMIQKIKAEFGTVHVLVNNAVRDANPIPFLELTWNKLEADLNVVLKGAFNCCQEVLPLMVEQRFGRIINLATVFVENPPANQSKYVMSKSALVGLTRSLAVEFARHNIQANLVVPSMVETDLSKNVPKIFAEKMKGETPMQRLASPVEVAKAIIFLASNLSSFTTGQKVMVTGGSAPLL